MDARRECWACRFDLGDGARPRVVVASPKLPGPVLLCAWCGAEARRLRPNLGALDCGDLVALRRELNDGDRIERRKAWRKGEAWKLLKARRRAGLLKARAW